MDMGKVIEAAVKAGALEQVSQMTGISQSDAGKVVNVVLPLLIKGMQGQAKGKDTQEGFFQALNDHGKNDPKDVKKFIKNVDTEDGAKIVNHLLGKSTEEVAAKAKKSSGLDTKTILRIMAMLAPLLMSQMGKEAKKETAKSNSNDMSGVVGSLLENVDVGDVIKIANILMK